MALDPADVISMPPPPNSTRPLPPGTVVARPPPKVLLPPGVTQPAVAMLPPGTVVARPPPKVLLPPGVTQPAVAMLPPGASTRALFGGRLPPPAAAPPAAAPPAAAPPPGNMSLLMAVRNIPEEIAGGVSVAASSATMAVVAATTAVSLVPGVISTMAAAASAGSTVSTATTAVSAAPKAVSAVSNGAGKGLGKAAGAGLVTVLDQMQSMAATGTMAPADMPGFTAVTGAVGWTTQLPVPFWNELGEPHRCCCSSGRAPVGVLQWDFVAD
jgi:hypothetical protein